ERRATFLPGFCTKMAQSSGRSRPAQADRNRPPFARRIPQRRSAQYGCMVQSLRCCTRRQAIFEVGRSPSNMVNKLRIAFVEWPEGLSVVDARWPALKESVVAAHPDILVTNELPFGPWIADAPV